LVMELVWPKQSRKPSAIDQSEPPVFTPSAGPAVNSTVATVYIQPRRTVQPLLIHLTVSLLLYQYLSNDVGAENISREYPTPIGTMIDMVKHNGDGLTYYKIKTCPSIKDCIREALGQLIEYSYWPGGQTAYELVIVTPHPATSAVITYMNKLRTTLNLPIWYQQFDLFQNALGDKA
jgi:hypothetical protein